MSSKTADKWYRGFAKGWCRYFAISDLISRACAAFDIDHDLAICEGHTKTGLAERRLGICKIGALKIASGSETRIET